MSANTGTWHNMKTLHRIFAASGTLMLLATICMLAKDHLRQWKVIQREASRLESRVTDWRQIQFQTGAARDEYNRRRETLQRARQAPLDAAAVAGFNRVLSADESARDGQIGSSLTRDEALGQMRGHIEEARFRESRFQRDQRAAAARRDEAAATLTLMIRDRRPAEQQQRQQAEVDKCREQVAALTRDADAARAHRRQLEQWLRKLTADEDRAQRELDASLAEWKKLQESLEAGRESYVSWYGWLPLPGKRMLELPFVDMFNSPRNIETLWGEGLEVDFNLTKVQRYDRCTTCHAFADRAAPGRETPPAWPNRQQLEFVLERVQRNDAPAAQPEQTAVAGQQQLDDVWGVRLSDEGLLQPNDVCVQVVWPDSPAARALPANRVDDSPAKGSMLRQAMLQAPVGRSAVIRPSRGLVMGDVIERVQGKPVRSRDEAQRMLLDAAKSSQRVSLTVRRGVPEPFASHPRLDLFLGSSSPHPMSGFGCTICHEGQGSATQFDWASHSPNDPGQRDEWIRRYGWFDNADWRFPMLPHRFVESGCLKCHPNVTELAATDRFGAPAPKVSRGYELVRTYGCFGCHEINGFRDGLQISPDVRAEPDYAAVAEQLKQDAGFNDWDEAGKALVEQVVQNPGQAETRRLVYERLLADRESKQPRFSRDTLDRLMPLWKDTEQPGTLRRVAPGLRHIKSKLEPSYLYEWIRGPREIRPSTRMPHPFGLTKHMSEKGRAVSERFEPLEILGMATYLNAKSQKYGEISPLGNIAPSSAEARAARGKILFQERGCLACHRHRDYSDADAFRDPDEMVLGPDLSTFAAGLDHEPGRKWLYSWIKSPSNYSARTRMPNTFLEPVRQADGQLTDPAADVVEYLLSASKSAWRPAPATLALLRELNTSQRASLDELVLECLRDNWPEADARRVLKSGLPAQAKLAAGAAELELAGSEGDAKSQAPDERKKLLYVGRKSLVRYGCSACHDIPGLEDAKPIGPALTDWGRKDEQQLAFESVLAYFDESPPPAADLPPFYLQQIQAGHRAGFAYQKLREPRGYDYRRTDNKRYAERLKMPQFALSDGDREAIITFLLGLVADAPKQRFVFQPDSVRAAQLAGRDVLGQYRCKSCHAVEPETWRVTFAPGQFAPRAAVPAYPFLHPGPVSKGPSAAQEGEVGGLQEALLQGMPTLSDDGLPLLLDEEGLPLEDDGEYGRDKLEYAFDLWKTASLEGQLFEAGVQPLSIPSHSVTERRPADGGFLSRYLLPHVVGRERALNASAKGAEAWGWLPPPLHAEGLKVQSGWLYEYLLNPAPIRPAVVLRMPRYNMSPQEATALARYFAANQAAEFPYEFRGRRQSDHLAQMELQYQALLRSGGVDPSASRTRLGDAMGIVTDRNYCIKCHRVGDFDPDVAVRSKGPDLTQVYLRLRPNYVRDWIADPRKVLPYTGMPVNIPYDPAQPHLGGISQQLCVGTSVQQLDSLVDLLMNYDTYVQKTRSPIQPSSPKTPAIESGKPASAPR